MAQMRPLMEENKKLCLDYLERTKPEEFSYTISYTTSAGYFESVISDCLIQMVNHATHHRGQVVKAIRDLGIAPPNTDYIMYCRKFAN